MVPTTARIKAGKALTEKWKSILLLMRSFPSRGEDLRIQIFFPSRDMLGAAPQSTLMIEAIMAEATIGMRGAYSVLFIISNSGITSLALKMSTTASTGIMMIPSPAFKA